ncbi:sensor histidine kinase [Methylobacterium isbiliense]|jgi:signal transduction histidine kinase|uniref:histidine kinase n=1 Tax=Methylobacterium isbiliense TaxID=315478 RepID=A0ABQ4S8N9_9HYPH|nr:HAMP domain-containing sensor histidine kinase [Methylobacterium isbiliense]MDN3621925.1 HAMP domain-containing sensor histidine kinase [Methylobacterium isbiliense]GJD99561.1 Adaptive-response sensory-kinase SasA [Methylobacterium isbiliense]
MRVGQKIVLVGGLPIAIAALIALAGWLLLAEAERARGGAVMAGTIYRTLTTATTVRDEFLAARADERTDHAERFARLTAEASRQLDDLHRLARTPDQDARIESARTALTESIDRMQGLVRITRENDGLIAEMATRADTLVRLADQARERQRAANLDLVASLTDKANHLRQVRDVVGAVNALRTVVAAQEIEVLRDGPARGAPLVTQVRNAARDLAEALRADGRAREAEEILILAAAYEGSRAAEEPQTLAATGIPAPAISPAGVLAEWCERVLKIDGSAQRSLHDEVSQLLAYAVRANETEQAAQNIALATLKLGQRTAEALRRRDPGTAMAALDEGATLSETAAALPISPLIQGEMLDAIDGWRARLGTTVEGLRRQNAGIAEMDRLAAAIGESARSLNQIFIDDADRFGRSIRHLLLVGATAGLVFGSAAALAVARSITAPLRRLQRGMLALAADPSRHDVGDTDRRDELGDMARATNVFVSEIGRRERALRRAKEEADRTLSELRQTQADLIQAEKLASLGQLVAGVAHEINTPLGIALTTATLVRDEAREFRAVAAGGQLSRSKLVGFVDRVQEGAHLLTANLGRAADLVHSFKQVAVDRVSDEGRRIAVRAWLGELLHSLGPLLRKGGHGLDLVCPEEFEIETYPGALAQVVTNLVKNAVVHAFREGQPGRITVTLVREGGFVRLDVADDGRGIAGPDRERIFDPFFTTARHRGSSGLGMHIVYNLVTGRLQGRIAVESREGQGTRVRVEFPAVPAPEAAGAGREVRAGTTEGART